MITIAWMFAALLVCGEVSSTGPSFTGGLASLFNGDIQRLDARRESLTTELASLPIPAGENSSVCLGWHSKPLPNTEANVWVQIDLGAVQNIDLVVLVSASGEGRERSQPGYGFPQRFRVDFVDAPDFVQLHAVTDSTNEDIPNPGALPIAIRTDGRRARFVRITCTKPWTRRDDWIVALGEIMVLSGQRNVAAGAAVQVSSMVASLPAWSPENLTDGQSLLGPPVASEPSSSNGFLARHEPVADVTKWVQVDLGREFDVEEVRLFPARPTDFADVPGTGFPLRFRIESGNDAEFRTCTTVFTTGSREFINPGDNAISFPCTANRGRYVRVTAEQLHGRGTTFSFGLAELQVLSHDINVALHKPVTASDLFDNPQYALWQAEYLVDGANSRHRILDLPEWLVGLDRRRQLQLELDNLGSQREAAVAVALSRAVNAGGGIGVALVLIVSGLAWRSHRARRREVGQLRTRIASDLHDEIGSQLGSIALAAQLANRRADDPATRERLAEIERIARETNEAMHDIVWLLKPGSSNLVELLARMREATSNQLRSHSFQFECPSDVVARQVNITFTRNVYLLFGCSRLGNIAFHLICVGFPSIV